MNRLIYAALLNDLVDLISRHRASELKSDLECGFGRFKIREYIVEAIFSIGAVHHRPVHSRVHSSV